MTALGKHNRRRERSPYEIFGAPLVIGLLSVVGLVAALLGDGLWDVVSWLAFGVPIVLMAWFAWPAGEAGPGSGAEASRQCRRLRYKK